MRRTIALMTDTDEFPPLRDAPKGRVPEIRNAYRYLRGAHASVSGLFDVVHTLAEARTADGDGRGRVPGEEVDLLRAAIVFTSSGLDASMKRLVNDAGRALIPIPGTGARREYELFLTRKLQEPGCEQRLMSALIDVDPAGALVKYYLSERSRASFQGSGDLEKRVRNCLGVAGSRVTSESLKDLDEFFSVRNSIVHSMDYVDVESSTKYKRSNRSVNDTATLCKKTFAVAADLIHAVADVVVAATSAPVPRRPTERRKASAATSAHGHRPIAVHGLDSPPLSPSVGANGG